LAATTIATTTIATATAHQVERQSDQDVGHHQAASAIVISAIEAQKKIITLCFN
jgi:hypothetical protein